MAGNTLYYGDNLDVLREHVPNESVDLIYLDPPFKSNQSYNVLFAERGRVAVGGADQSLRGHMALGSGGRRRLSGGGGGRGQGLRGPASLPTLPG